MPGEVLSMQRQIFTDEHDAFRDMVRAFIAKEITPYHDQWERDGIVSRDVWLAAGRAGLLGIHLDEKYGGGGEPDYRRSEEHTSELQSRLHLVCRLLLEKKKKRMRASINIARANAV